MTFISHHEVTTGISPLSSDVQFLIQEKLKTEPKHWDMLEIYKAENDLALFSAIYNNLKSSPKSDVHEVQAVKDALLKYLQYFWHNLLTLIKEEGFSFATQGGSGVYNEHLRKHWRIIRHNFSDQDLLRESLVGYNARLEAGMIASFGHTKIKLQRNWDKLHKPIAPGDITYIEMLAELDQAGPTT